MPPGRTEIGRNLSVPTRSGHEHTASAVTSGARAHARIGIGAVVQETQRVSALASVWYADDQRVMRQVDPGVRVQGVVVEHHHAALAGGQQLACAREKLAPTHGALGDVSCEPQPSSLARRGGRARELQLEQRPAVDTCNARL